jgi:hypothetical protein
MAHTNNVTSLVLIALAVILGGSLLAVAITPVVVYASTTTPPELPKECAKDFLNPLHHNPHCKPI